MATERKSDTIIKVYTSNRPMEDDTQYVKRAGRDDAHGEGEKTAFWLKRGQHIMPKAIRMPRTETVKRAKSAGRGERSFSLHRAAHRETTPYMKRMTRDTLVVCALLLGVMSLKALPFDWAQQTTAVMSQAVNMSVDLDKTLGQLQFVREVIPESAMVFWNGGSAGEYYSPFEGQITHAYSENQPWLEYVGQNQAVKSVCAGKIKQLEQGAAGDWAVRIEHEDGMETVYAFLSAVSVKVGDSITGSQEIGKASGANGARIYFEMRINGDSVDPSPYLGIK